MARQNHYGPLLAAEADPVNAERLQQCLLPLGQRVFLARSAEDVVGLVRREVFHRAVIAVELALNGELVLARLSKFSGLAYLVAVGPKGDKEREQRARSAGATVYVTRPVTTELLSRALNLPVADQTASSA